MLQADVDQLRKLTVTLDSVSDEIDRIDVRTAGDALGAALPGCALAQQCAQAGEFTEGAWYRVSQRIKDLSAIVTRCADGYFTTDMDFKNLLDTMDFRTQGQ